MPSAHCGVVGMRLSNAAWPVERDHFPRISPKFWSFCGMGPLARTVDDARRVVHALSSLRNDTPVPKLASEEIVLYGPDRVHLGEWPSFESDVSGLLRRADVRFEPARLPPPQAVHALFAQYLASHFDEFIEGDEIPLRDGIPAVLLGLLSRGRVDKRVHPNTAVLFALLGIGRLIYRDKARTTEALASLRADLARTWKNHLVVAPATTALPPRHGRAFLSLRMGTFCQLGNMTDATAIVVPFGRFEPSGMPRAVQVLGPAGSEDAVLDLAERLERAAAS
jgi:Asp-tRNA(Asn)/Glu-tRNA(Gln) amidotransferase A subunit family amidase